MDHRTFVASLSPEVRGALTETSDRAGLFHLAGHWAAIVALGVLIAAGVPGWWLLLPVQGVLLVFNFTLLHETVHRTPFRSEWLNIWVGRVCGVLLLLGPVWFRYFHLAHHKFTQIPGKDPELASPKPETWGEYLRHLSGIPVWIGEARTLVRNARGRCDDSWVPAGRRDDVAREARWMLALYALLAVISAAAGSTLLLWVWVIPAILGQPVLRLYLMAEHGRCAFVANMLENSRTTLTNRAVRWLAWNMPFHAEHHSWPTVPFHKLPELHALAKPHIAEIEDGYVAFHRGGAPDMRGRPA
ncbi:fatty acid desaturase family protein [Pelagovum pacificum]|uniref:Fatty acid desaturase n=1 Tax=Pelagovum pacificum TaxID=2588711 RepID=A0A5C5GG67_9RHOB|nr:fatty acid desaturase family protein [Pelagovum pacificum]QQA43156.1 fatty acid desaturase family protein [Pelagovum pacificum]TNY33702.1 fatty acid desaturase [Pelagovum pacificum]